MPTRESRDQRAARWSRIERRYGLGDPIVQIASDEAVDEKTVRNVARRAGLPLRLPRQTQRNKRILARYARGDRVIDIARDENVTSQCVSTLARNAGHPRRTGWQRRYPVDERAFDTPTDVGWWLIGLLAADGNVRDHDNQIALCQRDADVDVLHAFFEYVGCSDRPLTELRFKSSSRTWQRKGGRYFEARVFSARIRAALIAHGIVPRKTRSLRWSHRAAQQPAVWLGLLDGDGSLGATLNQGRPRIDWFGARPVMEQCSDFWGKRLTLSTGGSPSLIRHGGGLWKVAVYGANAVLAASVLLASSPVSMQRKRHKLEEIAALAGA